MKSYEVHFWGTGPSGMKGPYVVTVTCQSEKQIKPELKKLGYTVTGYYQPQQGVKVVPKTDMPAGSKKMELSRKQKALLRMHRHARAAAHARLRGQIHDATFWDEQIEKVYAEARRHGWSEGPFVRAEEEGRRGGGRLEAHTRRHGARLRDPSPRRRTAGRHRRDPERDRASTRASFGQKAKEFVERGRKAELRGEFASAAVWYKKAGAAYARAGASTRARLWKARGADVNRERHMGSLYQGARKPHPKKRGRRY